VQKLGYFWIFGGAEINMGCLDSNFRVRLD
jgi:hypothetical protein